MASERVLDVRALRAGYGKINVLWDVDLHVERGELVTIIGANGAGKTTLLRTISGLLPARSGAIAALGDQRLAGLSPARIVNVGVGHVPEGRQLFPLMTVRENLESGAEYLAHARPNAKRNLAYVLELFPRLAERAAQLAGTLSGGEGQMLAIGRALMSDPKVLLVDEPSIGLSPALSATVFKALEQVKSEGVSILLVEQNVLSSLRIADRAYVLENGEIRKEGRGVDLLNDPDVKAAYLSM
ncbi:MAG TPA: ABC transporter ATP-binding protein [Trueperaceae bacterium]|nr:ABC transporter ATP-binding protein [Trueperaceae bacterium]